MKKILIMIVWIAILPAYACQESENVAGNNPEEMSEETPMTTVEPNGSAQVIGVAISGQSGSYTFQVTIESPDTGCDQYADWWEVITPDGQLIYRRILAHSHVTEQPFTRSGPVDIDMNAECIVRAHMNNLGYGNVVYRGSVANGLIENVLEDGLWDELATLEPLPDDCAF